MNQTLSQKLFFNAFRFSAFFGVLVIVFVFSSLFYFGYSVLSPGFLLKFWSHQDITAGGIFPAIVGSLYIGIGVLLISFPLGIATAIFLTEYTAPRLWKRLIELAIQNLAGVPSVVYGLFGLSVFVNLFQLKTSLLSAILTLSVMTLPWIIAASVEALRMVPKKFRESSLALGATEWQTIQRVVIPASLPASITGGIVGIARALGETAPIIIVGATFYLSSLPTSLTDKFMALPYHIFILATQHSSPFALQYAAATAIVLIILTFILSIGGITARYYLRKKRDW